MHDTRRRWGVEVQLPVYFPTFRDGNTYDVTVVMDVDITSKLDIETVVFCACMHCMKVCECCSHRLLAIRDIC